MRATASPLAGRAPSASGGRDRQGAEHPLGVEGRPLQHLHAAHRAAGDAEQRLDAEAVDQLRLSAHHVANRHDGEIEAVRFARGGIERGGPGGAQAAADHVGADDEEAVGVERSARADHGLPPTVAPGDGVTVGDVLIARQRVTHQDRVALGGVEHAIGLIGDGQRREIDAGFHRKRSVRAELQHEAVRRVRFARPLRFRQFAGFIQGGCIPVAADLGESSVLRTSRLI